MAKKPLPKKKPPKKKPSKVIQKQTQKQTVVVNINQPARRKARKAPAPKSSQQQGNVTTRMIRMNEPAVPLRDVLGVGQRIPVTEPLKPIVDYSQLAGLGRKTVPDMVYNRKEESLTEQQRRADIKNKRLTEDNYNFGRVTQEDKETKLADKIFSGKMGRPKTEKSEEQLNNERLERNRKAREKNAEKKKKQEESRLFDLP
tara:strand:- start:1098 stop:1700 length:603 start_codon:yes stop_codon:yes gene_type:complete